MDVFPCKFEKNQELILKTNGETQEATIVHPDVSRYLKVHQVDGIKFLFKNCFEKNSGCILAHCMGLGKTLQVISLIHTVINSREYETNKILVLCPISTIMNWKEEIVRWLSQIDDGHRKLQILELEQKDSIDRKLSILQNWSQCDSKSPAVCLIMGYQSFRNLVNFHTSKANANKYKESSLRQIRDRIQKYLLTPPDIVICDEGHAIKNNTAAITLAVNQIRTKKRIILTGTPMQNHLMEYYSMVNFVKPNFLSTKQHFNEYFAEPIKNGQHADSCETDIKYMKQRSYALHKKLSKIVQRREISLLKDFLPEKFEFVLFVPLTQIQYDLYKYFLDNRGGVIEYKRLFGDYTCLRKIWTHLKVLDNAHQKSVAKKKRTSKNDDDSNDDDDADEEYASAGGLQMVANDWWRKVIDKKQLENASSSHKMIILFEILNECQRAGDKCVIFSSFVEVLNVVEFFMQQIDQRNGKGGLENFVGPWRKNENYYRLDGSTPKERRHSMIKNFNDVSNTRTKAFLISSDAGGQGINLFGANRLILLDTSWNPSKDQQSIFRIYRMGQTKHCYIYRLLSMGTMEEKIYSRSVTKQAMSCRVVDKQQVDRHYSMNELDELYSLTKTDMGNRVAPVPPKDGILANLLRKYPNMIFKYLEHDSLLANKVEEELNDIEKNEAWQRCQEQNLQMQALNNMMTDGQQAPFKLHNQIGPALELKQHSTVHTGSNVVHSQHFKETVSNGKKGTGSLAANSINMELDHPEDKLSSLGPNPQMDTEKPLKLPSSDDIKSPIETSNDAVLGPLLSLKKLKNDCDDSVEVEVKVPQSTVTKGFFEPSVSKNEPSFTSNGIEHPEDKLSSLVVDTKIPLKRSYEWLPPSNDIKVETSNDTALGPLLTRENCCDDNTEAEVKGSQLTIEKDIFEPNFSLNGPAPTSNELKREQSEDKLSSFAKNEGMDVQTSLQYTNSYESLPPSNDVKTPIETSKDAVLEPLLSLEKFDYDDSNEAELEEPRLAIEKVYLNGPSSTSNEIEHSEEKLSHPAEHRKDKLSPFADNQETDMQSSLQYSNSYEWLPPSNNIKTPTKRSNDAVLGPSLEKIDCDNIIKTVVNGPQSAIDQDVSEPNVSLNGPSSTSNYSEREQSADELNHLVEHPEDKLIDDQEMDVQTSLQYSNSYEWLPLSSETSSETSNESSDLSNREPLNQLKYACNGHIDEGAESSLTAAAKYIFKPDDLFIGNELERSLTDSKQMNAKTSFERSKSSDYFADPNALFELSNEIVHGILSSLDFESNDSLDHDTQGTLISLENLSNNNNQGIGETSSLLVKNILLDDTQGSLQNYDNGSNDSSTGDTERLSLGNVNYDNMKVIGERSLSDFVKGLLQTLNDKFAASSQHPYSMEDYATEEHIFGPNGSNNLEYRIALKRPASGALLRPIKRMKLSLEIDPMAAITVDQIMSTLPLTTDCQLNVVMDNGSQSLNAGDDYVQFLNPTAVDNTSEACLKIAQQSNEIVPALPSADCGEHYFDLDVELNQTIVNTNEVAGEELETVRVDSKFPVDIENEKDMSSNEPTERINPNDAYNNEPAEDERMSSDEEEEVVTPTNSYGRLQSQSQSEDEHDSPAGMMSESETSDADEDLNETPPYEERPSTMSRIKENCVVM